MRDGEGLKNLGRMADLIDDPTLIQIGTEGRFRELHFRCCSAAFGAQAQAGLWNRWHILFDDARSAWLSEAGGEYVVSSQVPVSDALPAFGNAP